jgi:hypothetical protein
MREKQFFLITIYDSRVDALFLFALSVCAFSRLYSHCSSCHVEFISAHMVCAGAFEAKVAQVNTVCFPVCLEPGESQSFRVAQSAPTGFLTFNQQSSGPRAWRTASFHL